MTLNDPKKGSGKPDGKPEGKLNNLQAGEVGGLSNAQLIRRMLGLAWRYRRGCVAVLILHLILVSMVLGALSLMGLGLAVIRHQVSPDSQSPLWPFSLTPPGAWSAYDTVWLIGGIVLGIALLHGILRFAVEVGQATLVQQIIISLRAKVYDKLQRLSFRFFDGRASSF